ncbi:cation/H(+) antiporter 4-like [Juglans microcarpa x Juglans regia]|uniref:cation/H(+) antiporter 4-like n=1 Tax=Juglans microcarpa x Juglans regia TaxID=2249226 RepID=UPI001B7EEE2D|nr:cation/H(+) antiporter 4-like [Juglans microcarpa x Juglans regia]
MAWGLANSQQPFPWVVRPDPTTASSDWKDSLPEGFREATGERLTTIYIMMDGRSLPYPSKVSQQFEIQMIVVFLITQAFHCMLKRQGMPPFTSQLITGLVLSPPILGHLKVFRVIFSSRSQELIYVLGFIGQTLFVFLSAVKTDMGMMKRMGRKAFCTGIACQVSPLLFGNLLQFTLKKCWLPEEMYHKNSILTAAHSLTSFPVVVYLLEHLRILNSELGQLALSASLVSDLSGLMIMVLFEVFRISTEISVTRAMMTVGSILIYLFLIAYAFRPAMFWVVRKTPEGKPVKGMYIHIIMALMFLSGLYANYNVLPFFLGPFVLGMAVPAGPPLGSTIVSKLNCFTEQVFHPLYVTAAAMKADMHSVTFSDRSITFNIILICSTFVAKMVGSLVPPLYSKMPLNDALAVALILSFKGVNHLTIYFCTLMFKEDPKEGEAVFSLLTIAILVNALIIPVLVKYLYDPSRKYAGYQKRDIMHCRGNAELRVLVCIHGSANVATTIKLLEAACLSRERPLEIYVLHLIPLIGRASPIFISHNKQKTVSSSSSFSENIIVPFERFKQERKVVGLSLNLFTAITPPKCMHEDICTLALDRLTSLIVLPFHRKWSIDGSFESDDNNIRTLNYNVLQLAPCSVGILVDRGHLGRSMASTESSYSVAMFFLGGNDDQEAIIFAKRLAGNTNITLTVVHLVASETDGDIQIDNLLDFEVLKDVKRNNVGNAYVIYSEEKVEDGPQTAMVIRSMAYKFDLIIVGRRHNIDSPQTSGLAEWSEFPELGVIGDLLASSDVVGSKASILVVQQQQTDDR